MGADNKMLGQFDLVGIPQLPVGFHRSKLDLTSMPMALSM